MTIEVLYPSVCNLYGETYNHRFLKMCLPEAEFIYTDMPDEPYFVTHDVDMVYMGSMSEKMQPLAVKNLMPYKSAIEALIEKNVIFLATGNSFELFLNSIENVTSGEKFDGLGLFDLTAKLDLFNRFNANIIGKFEDFEVMGFKSQFSLVYGDNSGFAFMENIRGAGINRGTSFDGVRRNNFIGTHLIGPLLVLNPKFTRWLLDTLGCKDAVIPHLEELEKAYEIRRKELHDPKTAVDFV